MSQTLDVLQEVSSFYTTIPSGKGFVEFDLLEEIKKIVQSVVQGIVDDFNHGINTVLDGISDGIKGKIKEVYDFLSGIGTTIYNYLFDANTGVVSQVISKVTEVVNGVIDDINSTLGGIGDAISAAIGAVVDAINSIIQAVNNIGTSIENAIKSVINSIATWVANAVSDVVDAATGFISNAIDAVSGWLTTAYNNVRDWIVTAINNVGDWVSGAYDTVVNAINSVGEWISDTYNNVKNFIVDKWDALIQWIKDLVASIRHWLAGVFTKLADFMTNNVLPLRKSVLNLVGALGNKVKDVWGHIEHGDYAGALADINKVFDALGVVAPTEIAYGVLSAFAYFYETIKLQFVPMNVAASKHAEISLAMTPLELGIAHEGLERGVITEKEYLENARLAGMTSDRAKQFMLASEPLTPPQVLHDIYIRGFIDEKTHDAILSSYGFTKERIAHIKESYPVIPGITDLVHFADRFAWDDDIATRFKYDTEFPDIVNDWAKKIGLSADWFKRYWRSHWQLPSLQDIFEMYHRLRPGEVDRAFVEADLDAYLKTTPLPPYFHELLKEITYMPLTRVDIRRMFKAGVLNEQQVYKAYLDLGYDKVRATHLKDYTIRYYTPEDSDQRDEFFSMARGAYSTAYKHHMLSKPEYVKLLKGLIIHDDDINLLISIDDWAISEDNKLFNLKDQHVTLRKLAINAYAAALINVNDMNTLLKGMGYSQDEVNLELTVLDYNRRMEDRQTIVDQLHEQYTSFIIDNTELHTAFSMFNFTGDEIDRLVSTWNIERSYRTKRPTLSDIRKFFNENIITQAEFLDELRGEGYNEKYITMYEKMLTATT